MFQRNMESSNDIDKESLNTPVPVDLNRGSPDELPPEGGPNRFPNRSSPPAHIEDITNKTSQTVLKDSPNKAPQVIKPVKTPLKHLLVTHTVDLESCSPIKKHITDLSPRVPTILHQNNTLKPSSNRDQPESHAPGIANVADLSNRLLPVIHRDESPIKPLPHRPESLLFNEAHITDLSNRVNRVWREELEKRWASETIRRLSDNEDPLSSDEMDVYSDSLPADLSNPRGVAHGVFGTGNGKTLPEMIQSGRNAGLPLYVRCPICQKEFKQKSTLLQHGCIHIESRPYPCGECGKRFRQQSHLTQHLRIHTNEKPYGCLYCGRNFRQRTILNQHVRIHTGEKPYKCAQCGKDFRQKAILDQHTRTHQGDRPYCCPLPNCRRRFAAEAEVKRHVENHVGPKRKPPPPMNPTPLVKPELYLPQCYTHPGNFQQQYAMSQLLGSTPPQPTALVQ